jgi:predicted deacylase
MITEGVKGNLICEASRAGIHSIILEASRGLATYDEEDIQTNMKSIHNLLMHLGMIEGRSEIPSEWKREETQIHILKAEKGGLLYLNCKYGEKARKGQKLGEIRNLRGKTLQELIAPIDGIIHYVFPKHVKRPGEGVIGMRRIL